MQSSPFCELFINMNDSLFYGAEKVGLCIIAYALHVDVMNVSSEDECVAEHMITARDSSAEN